MKCPRCGGNGSVPYPIDYEQGLFDETNCPLCGGSGEVITEQEYIQTCNTEQLAKAILFFCQYPCEICKIECDDGNACTYNKALNTIVEWLKQPHK